MSNRDPAQCLVALMSGEWQVGQANNGPAGGRPCAPPLGDSTLRSALHMQRVMLAGTVASGYVHDINNLLTVIEHGAAAAVDALPQDHPARYEVQLALQAAATAGAMSRGLLSFVRRQPHAVGFVDLRDLLARSLPLLRRIIGQRIVIETRLEPATWTVWASPVQIEQILLNLLVNARNAMPHGGRVMITTSNLYAGEDQGLAPGAYVCLTIADSGAGIGAELIGRAFEPFVTADPSGNGTGLGLATCRYLVQQLGGAITLQSRPGEGTTCSIYLPRAEGAWDDLDSPICC